MFSIYILFRISSVLLMDGDGDDDNVVEMLVGL